MVKSTLLISFNAKSEGKARGAIASEFIDSFPDTFKEEDRKAITANAGLIIDGLKTNTLLLQIIFVLMWVFTFSVSIVK